MEATNILTAVKELTDRIKQVQDLYEKEIAEYEAIVNERREGFRLEYCDGKLALLREALLHINYINKTIQ